MKVFIGIFLCMCGLHAVEQSQLIGNWEGATISSNNGTSITEKEYFTLNANRTFTMTMFVNLKKEDAFVRDLRIEGTGIWRVKDNTLVLVVNKVDVPFAKEIYRISQQSLTNLANNFRQRFEQEPIRLNTIKYSDNTTLILVNETSKETRYFRH